MLVGLGIQTVQTTGLALATDLVDKPSRPRMVAMMYAMLLVGMVGSGLLFSLLLQDFSPLRLIQVVQGAASLVLAMNLLAMWKQEPRRPDLNRTAKAPHFRLVWRQFLATPGHRRFLVAVFMGTAAFSMQDIILEPYGAEVLGMSVSQTTFLTVLLASGALMAFWLSAVALRKGYTAHLLAAVGALVGTVAFSFVIFLSRWAAPCSFRSAPHSSASAVDFSPSEPYRRLCLWRQVAIRDSHSAPGVLCRPPVWAWPSGWAGPSGTSSQPWPCMASWAQC